MSANSPSNRLVATWLIIVCITIFTMVVVGGITRLTESGLSMVDWRPVTGIVPPIGEAEWQAVFDDYKHSPQYKKVNHGMTLDEFKYIFYWEYGHRVLGRLIGMMFFIPFVIFMVLGKIEASLKPKLWIALVLGGLQGFMGWYMVKSGLVDIPRVSHYRLAAHLMLALVIFAYLSWLVMGIVGTKISPVGRQLKPWAHGFALLLFIQILYGAFVAGSRAGYGFNTYPLMNGEFLPDLALSMSPFWENFFDNNTMLQFLHRWIGAAVLLLAGWLCFLGWKSGDTVARNVTTVLLAAVIGQFLLGVFTLIHVVPIGLASIHQAGACVVVLATTWLVFSTRGGTSKVGASQ